MTVAQDLQKISQTLGELTGAVEAMRADVTRRSEDTRRFEDETRQSRRAIHEKLEAQEQELDVKLRHQDEALTQIKAAAADTQREVAELAEVMHKDVKPQTDKLKRWELMGVGFLTMAGIAGAGLMTVIVNYGEAIIKFFTGGRP